MIWVGIALLVSSVSVALALRPSVDTQLAMWLTVGIPYALMAIVAVFRLKREGVLRERIALQWGDFSVGAVTGLLLVGVTWVARARLMPMGSPGQAWVAQLLWRLGDPTTLRSSVVITGLMLVVPICEELVWRGLVLEELSRKLGARRAWPLAAALYGVAALPSAFTLAVPGIGLNPVLVLGALGCGMVWGFMVNQTRRLPAATLSHVVFTYFTATQFQLPGM